MRKNPKQKERWVIKAGSKMVLSGGPILMRAWMNQVFKLRQNYNIEVIWVTSGAIAWAKERLGSKKEKYTLPEKQALSAIGQPLVMDQYNLAMQSVGLLGAQVLLTSNDIKNKTHKRNLHNTLTELLKKNVTPILNENDAVATHEIQFGDNDTLASLVATMMHAKRLILLTDVDGLYDKDPSLSKNAKLIKSLSRITKNEKIMASKKSSSNMGKGGMYSKVLAAEKALKYGIVTHLARGDSENQLIKIAGGEPIGTQIGILRHKK